MNVQSVSALVQSTHHLLSSEQRRSFCCHLAYARRFLQPHSQFLLRQNLPTLMPARALGGRNVRAISNSIATMASQAWHASHDTPSPLSLQPLQFSCSLRASSWSNKATNLAMNLATNYQPTRLSLIHQRLPKIQSSRLQQSIRA